MLFPPSHRPRRAAGSHRSVLPEGAHRSVLTEGAHRPSSAGERLAPAPGGAPTPSALFGLTVDAAAPGGPTRPHPLCSTSLLMPCPRGPTRPYPLCSALLLMPLLPVSELQRVDLRRDQHRAITDPVRENGGLPARALASGAPTVSGCGRTPPSTLNQNRPDARQRSPSPPEPRPRRPPPCRDEHSRAQPSTRNQNRPDVRRRGTSPPEPRPPGVPTVSHTPSHHHQHATRTDPMCGNEGPPRPIPSPRSPTEPRAPGNVARAGRREKGRPLLRGAPGSRSPAPELTPNSGADSRVCRQILTAACGGGRRGCPVRPRWA